MNEKGKIALTVGAIIIVVAGVITATVAISSNNSKDNNQTNSSEQRDNNTSATTDTATSPIVGKWTYDDEELANAGIYFTYTFNSNGTGNYDAGGTDMPFTYTIDGNKLSIVYETGTFETEFSINGDLLNVKDSGGNDTIYKKVN